MRQDIDFALHVGEIKKRGKQTKLGDNEYEISNLDTRKNEMIEELKIQNITVLKKWFLE